MDYVLGIDLGTSNFKFAVVGPDGRLVGFDREPVSYDWRRNSDGSVRCELGVDAFISLVRKGISRACIDGAVDPSRIVGVSYASQANTVMLLGEDDEPLTQLVSWQDTELRPDLETISPLVDHREFLARTGMGKYSNAAGAARIMWFRTREPAIWRKVRKVVNISDYFLRICTGADVGDAGTAARLGMWDFERESWWDRALEIVGVETHQLPRIIRPGTDAGRVSRIGARVLGLSEGTPVTAGSLDHHVAALGAGVGVICESCESTGTVLSCVRFIEAQGVRRVGMSVGPDTIRGRYYAVAHDDAGGAVLQQFRDQYAPSLSYGELDALAVRADASLVELVRAYAADPFETLSTIETSSDGELSADAIATHARAIMEAGALRLRRLVNLLFGHDRLERIGATGGGATSEVWTQIKADIVGSTFLRLEADEPGCLGAAGLAGIGAEWHDYTRPVPESWLQIRSQTVPTDAYLSLIAAPPTIGEV